MAISPVVAMDNGNGDKKRPPVDQLNDQVKKMRLDEDSSSEESTEDEVAEEIIEEVNEQLTTLHFDETREIDWEIVEDLIGSVADYEEVIETHCPNMINERNDFEKLLLIVLQYNEGLTRETQPIIGVIEKQGPAILKYILNIHEPGQYERFEAALKSGAISVDPLNLLCVIMLQDRHLFKLLLQYAKCDVNLPRYKNHSLCGWIVSKMPESITLWLDHLCACGYKPNYDDLKEALSRGDFEAFAHILLYVTSERFSSVFSCPNSKQNILYEILTRKLSSDYVELLVARDNLPQCDFKRFAVSLYSNYCLQDDSVKLDQNGQEILDMICTYFKIDPREYSRIIGPRHAMITCIANKDAVACEKMLLQGYVNPNDYIGEYCSYLTQAIVCKSIDCMRILIAHGADINPYGIVLDEHNYRTHCSERVKDEIQYARAIQFLQEFSGWQTNGLQISQLPVMRFLEQRDDFAEGRTGGCLDGFYLGIANNPTIIFSYLDEDATDKGAMIKFMLRYPKVAEPLIFSTLCKWFKDPHKNIMIYSSKREPTIIGIPNDLWLESEMKCNVLAEQKKNTYSTAAYGMYSWYKKGEALKTHLLCQKFSDVKFNI